MDWQPIETAPKDGTEALLYFPKGCWMGGNIMIGFYDGRDPDPREHGWYDNDAASHDMGQPTHWMPLPKSPAM